MKIEMGESLFYSWLRHVKNCKLVQLNWKTSPMWQISNENELIPLIDEIDKVFPNIFKKNRFKQLLSQAELDAFGVDLTDKYTKYYVVDVACHLINLGYGSKEENIAKVSEKMLRSAIVLYAYFKTKQGEIIFAAPKINKGCYDPLAQRVADIEKFMRLQGFDYKFTLIANKDFNDVVDSIESLSDDVADTSELFLRSYQLHRACKN